MPVDLLSCYRCGFNLAVDLGFNYQCEESIEDPLAVAIQALDIMGTEIARLNQERYADLTLFPDVKNVDIYNKKSAEKAIIAGEKVADEKIKNLKRKLIFSL